MLGDNFIRAHIGSSSQDGHAEDVAVARSEWTRQLKAEVSSQYLTISLAFWHSFGKRTARPIPTVCMTGVIARLYLIMASKRWRDFVVSSVREGTTLFRPISLMRVSSLFYLFTLIHLSFLS